MVNKNLYVNSLNWKLLYIANKMFGVFDLEQEMSLGGTILYSKSKSNPTLFLWVNSLIF